MQRNCTAGSTTAFAHMETSRTSHFLLMRQLLQDASAPLQRSTCSPSQRGSIKFTVSSSHAFQMSIESQRPRYLMRYCCVTISNCWVFAAGFRRNTVASAGGSDQFSFLRWIVGASPRLSKLQRYASCRTSGCALPDSPVVSSRHDSKLARKQHL